MAKLTIECKSVGGRRVWSIEGLSTQQFTWLISGVGWLINEAYWDTKREEAFHDALKRAAEAAE
jgi:hypothetical protein